MSFHSKNLPADERRTVTIKSVVELAGTQNPSKITTAAAIHGSLLVQLRIALRCGLPGTCHSSSGGGGPARLWVRGVGPPLGFRDPADPTGALSHVATRPSARVLAPRQGVPCCCGVEQYAVL